MPCDFLPQDELKPVQVAAWRNNHEAVELLLPLTSPIPGVSNWNVDGIIEHMLPKEYEEKVPLESPFFLLFWVVIASINL